MIEETVSVKGVISTMTLSGFLGYPQGNFAYCYTCVSPVCHSYLLSMEKDSERPKAL